MRIIKQKYMYGDEELEFDFVGKKILDFGCGENKFKGAIGVELIKTLNISIR